MTDDDAGREFTPTDESPSTTDPPSTDRPSTDGDAAGNFSNDLETDGPIVLFDGVCNLCNGLVDWVIEHDPEGTFRFAPLQSEVGQRLLERHDLSTGVLETFVLIDDGARYTKSTAALELFRRVGFPYSLLYAGVIVPRFVRDRAYDFVADRRYGWFGERDACRMPSPEIRDRFLE